MLGGTDSGLFNIDAASDAVTFKGAPNFEAPADALAQNVYDITVTASGSVLGFPARAVAITVTDVFDVILGTQVPYTLNGTAQNDTLQGRKRPPTAALRRRLWMGCPPRPMGGANVRCRPYARG